MKIRWTQHSVRFRITPTELDAITKGETIGETLILLNGKGWRAAITSANQTSLSFGDGTLLVELSERDRQLLAEPDREGVYFEDETARVRYFVEKDFPCTHPRAADALEPESETFAPPPGFEARKNA